MSLTFAVVLIAAWLSGLWNDCLARKADDCSDTAAGCLVVLILGLVGLTFGISGVHELWRRWLWKGVSHENAVSNDESNDESEKFDVGRLPETTGNIALFVVIGTLFALLETQTPLRPEVRIAFTLYLGLIYPAGIILGLARSTAAATKNYCVPPWIIIQEDKNTGEPLGHWLKRNFIGRLP
jgi:hypothetical protein